MAVPNRALTALRNHDHLTGVQQPLGQADLPPASCPSQGQLGRSEGLPGRNPSDSKRRCRLICNYCQICWKYKFENRIMHINELWEWCANTLCDNRTPRSGNLGPEQGIQPSGGMTTAFIASRGPRAKPETPTPSQVPKPWGFLSKKCWWRRRVNLGFTKN